MKWMDQWDERNKRTLDAHNRGDETPVRRWVEWLVAAAGLIFLAGIVVIYVQSKDQQDVSGMIDVVGAIGFFLLMAFAARRTGGSR